MKLRTLLALALCSALSIPGRAAAQITVDSITLSWTTPGDDGTAGTAAQFDLRYSTSTITNSNFSSATRWNATPTPTAPGTRQSATVTGLQSATLYYFAIKTADEVPNWSPISNVLQATTATPGDAVPPAALAINVVSVTDLSATLSWTAVGDDGTTGTATSYDVRYRTAPITDANWSTSTQATGEPTPTVAGSTQTFTVTGLTRQQIYYFAARATDDGGNISPLSNVPNVTTPDTMAPAAINDLAVGWLFMSWHGSYASGALRPRFIDVH